MVYLSRVNNQNVNTLRNISFGQSEKKGEQKEPALLLYKEKKEHPIKTTLQIEGNKLKNAFTTYPAKGFEGSKNANFYEFLTMGTVPYLVGSGMMMAVFNLASKFFDTPAMQSSAKLGKKMAFGVAFYGLAKTLSKKFIEEPLNQKYGIDVNVPYRKKIDELPEERNKDNLVSYEYHKAYESVDFPYWDLFYNKEEFGTERDSYFRNVGKKMGFSDEDLEHSDQKVKPLIREKLIQTKAFSTISSYLWAAVGVGIAMQEPFGRFQFPKMNLKEIGNSIVDFGKKFAQSTKEFVGTGSLTDYIVNKCKKQPLNSPSKLKPVQIAGRLLLASAVGSTLLGNFFTLTDFNKDRGKNPDTKSSLIDDSKEKVVC